MRNMSAKLLQDRSIPEPKGDTRLLYIPFSILPHALFVSICSDQRWEVILEILILYFFFIL